MVELAKGAVGWEEDGLSCRRGMIRVYGSCELYLEIKVKIKGWVANRYGYGEKRIAICTASYKVERT